jgi:hypothetical protein
MPETHLQVPISADLLGPPCPRVFELARTIATQNWVLIGGLMVQAHAMAASISAVRPTDDVDVIIRVGTTRPNALTTVTQGLRELGYSPLESLNRDAFAHRYVRGREIIDLGIADHLGARVPRLGGRPVLQIEGGRQAAERAVQLRFAGSNLDINVPDRLGALVLKGAAYLVDSRDKDRHLRDAAVLAATITDHRTELRRLKGSDGRRIRHLQQALADPRHIAWLSLPAELRVPGQDTLRILGSDPPKHAMRSDG